MTKRDADYFSQKYSLTRTHSEVLHAATIVPPGRALDLGCGNGRNSLYLAANGFAVTAWDKNPMSVNNLESIRAAERLDNLQTAVKDLNSLSFDGEYDLILSCGDLSARYLSFLVTMARCPLLYVHGNHDANAIRHPAPRRPNRKRIRQRRR